MGGSPVRRLRDLGVGEIDGQQPPENGPRRGRPLVVGKEDQGVLVRQGVHAFQKGLHQVRNVDLRHTKSMMGYNKYRRGGGGGGHDQFRG